jgi:hypothetical protein
MKLPRPPTLAAMIAGHAYTGDQSACRPKSASTE